MSQPGAGAAITKTEHGVLLALSHLSRLVALPNGALVNARSAHYGDRIRTTVSRPLMAAAYDHALAFKGIPDTVLPQVDTQELFLDALEQSFLDLPSVPGLDAAWEAVGKAMEAYVAETNIAEGWAIMATAMRRATVLEITITWPFLTRGSLVGPVSDDEVPMPALRAMLAFDR